MDWPMVALVLGVLAFVFGVYATRSKARDSLAAQAEAELRSGMLYLRDRQTALDAGLTKVEAALRIDGKRAMSEAAKGNLPAFMKALALCVATAGLVSAVSLV